MPPPFGRRLAAGVVFGAASVLFGIVTHLAAELAALGWRPDLALLLSARHAYLPVLAVVAFAGIAVALRSVGGGERIPRIDALVAALPFGGEGLGFIGASTAAQFAFFLVTQVAEGCPVGGGDIVAALAAALLAAALGALAVTFGKRRFLELVGALVWAISRLVGGSAERAQAFEGGPPPPAARCTPFSFRYRPPPQAA